MLKEKQFYLSYWKDNIKKIEDVLAFLTRYVSNLSGRDIKVKVSSNGGAYTDLLGSIYLPMDKIVEFMNNSENVQEAALDLSSDTLHELLHWLFTDKDAWDNGITKHKAPNEQQLKQYLINSLEDGRIESFGMNEYYGMIYPLMYSNQKIYKEKDKRRDVAKDMERPLDMLLENILSMSVNHKLAVKEELFPQEMRTLHSEIISLIKQKHLWTLPHTQAVVELTDIIFDKIMEFIKQNQQQMPNPPQQQPSPPQQGQGDEKSDSQSDGSGNNQGDKSDKNKDTSSSKDQNGEKSEGQDNEGQGQSGEQKDGDKSQGGQSGSQSQDGQQGKGKGKGNPSSSDKTNDSSNGEQSEGKSSEQGDESKGQGQSSSYDLNDIDFESLKELVKNYKEEAPGRKGFQETVDVNDHINFSNIMNDIDINLSDIKEEKLSELGQKHNPTEEKEFVYTGQAPKKGGNPTSSDSSSSIAMIPDLLQLPNELSSHKGIKIRMIEPLSNALSKEIYDKLSFAVSTEVDELVYLIQSILNKKQEESSESLYTGVVDQRKLINFAFNDYDIFHLFENVSNEITDSMFIGVDLSGSMGPRQKYVTKALILLHLALKQLNVKHAIFGFNTSGRDTCHYPLVTFDNWDEDDTGYNIAGIHTTGANRDGLSIRVFNEYIKESGLSPLYITITDGNPNHTNYSGEPAIQDTKQALEEMGLPTVAICLGDKENINISAVYDNALECEDVQDIPEMLFDFLLDVLA